MEKPWALIFGNSNDDWANYSTFDGEYLYICGNTWSFDGKLRPFIAKFNVNEKEFEWCKVITNAKGGAYRLLIKNNKIIAWGSEFLVCLDQYGNVLWGYRINPFYSLYSLLNLKESILACGSSGQLILFNENGKIIKNLVIGAENSRGEISNLELNNACYVNERIYLIGYTPNLISEDSNSDFLLICLDRNLNPLWSIAFGGNSHDVLRDICHDDEYLYVCGETWSYGFGKGDVFVSKLSLDGDILWSKVIGGHNEDYARSIHLVDGYLYIVGGTKSYNSGNWNFFIAKLDKNGNVVRTWTIGGNEREIARTATLYNNSSLIISGFSKTWTFGKRSAIIVFWPLEYEGEIEPKTMRSNATNEKLLSRKLVCQYVPNVNEKYVSPLIKPIKIVQKIEEYKLCILSQFLNILTLNVM